MKRLLALVGFTALLALPTYAQSYKCVGGELLGGPEGYTCETNAQGEITSVQPGNSQSRSVTTTRTMTRSAPVTQTVRRQTHVAPRPHITHQTAQAHSHGRTTHTHIHTHTDGTRHSHAHSHGQVTSHVTTTHRPVTTVRPAPRPLPAPAPRPAPVPATCDFAYKKISDTRDGRPRYNVCYSDLKPITGATADSLYSRIRTAARRACRSHGFSIYGASRSCERDAIYDAIVDVNLPALDRYYASKTGKRVPRVTVGPLRR